MAESFKIEWSDIAADDLEAIIDYILSHDGIAPAEAVHARIMKRIETLSSLPQRCRIVPELREIGETAFRELIVPPYRIFFRLYRNKVVLVGILDSRRDLQAILIERALD